MGAPQIVDGPPSQTTGRERILPDMRWRLRLVWSQSSTSDESLRMVSSIRLARVAGRLAE